ncbi:hypothetical protein Sste5344_010421 [Sporothrix stenoceras]
MDAPFDIEIIAQDITETQTPIYSFIKAIFQSPETVSKKVAKLSDEIRNGANAVDDTNLYTWDLWMIILDIAIRTPPDHPWQDILVGALQHVQQTGGHPADISSVECTLEDMEMWKNQNSFAARITTETYAPWLNFPILAIKDAVDKNGEVDNKANTKKEDKEDKEDQEVSAAALPHKQLDKHTIWVYHLWIATEWLLRAGDIVFKKSLAPGKWERSTDPEKAAAEAIFEATLPPRRERLPWWKKRFAEFLDKKEKLGLSADLVERVAKSVEAIEKFQIDHPEAEEVTGPTKEAAKGEEGEGQTNNTGESEVGRKPEATGPIPETKPERLYQEEEKKTGGDGA